MMIKNRSFSTGSHPQEPYIDGWLYKWTNYIKLYQKRWFVLDQGSLSYYRNPTETGLTCRGTISLTDASIQAEEGNNFLVTNGHQAFHLRANNEIERQRWIMMLELARSKQPLIGNSANIDHRCVLSTSTDSNITNQNQIDKAIYKVSPRTKIINQNNNHSSSIDPNNDSIVRKSGILCDSEHVSGQQQHQNKHVRITDAIIHQQDMITSTATESEEEDDYPDEISPIRDILEVSTKDLSDKLVQLKQQALVFNESTSKFANSLLLLYSHVQDTKSTIDFADHCNNSPISTTSSPAYVIENQPELFSNILKNVTMVQEALDNMTILSESYVMTAEEHQRKWRKSIVREQNNRAGLEDLVEQLARQQSEYEEEFFDAEEGSQQEMTSTNKDEVLYGFRSSGAPRIQSSNINLTNSRVQKLTPNTGLLFVPMDSKSNLSDDTDNTTSAISKNNESAKLRLGRTPIVDHTSSITEPSHKVYRLQHVFDATPLNIESMNENDAQSKNAINNLTSDVNKQGTPECSPSTNTSKNMNGAITSKDIVKKRRTVIPHRLNQSLNLWSIMKNCIGKELTKIPIPVNFNEPLSMLQRLTEDYEYAHELLHSAAKILNPLEQLVYIAVFAVTSYSTTSNRTGKPFNPLLGETYECDRRSDLGWRCINEQVSHHPPMMASHCEGRGWVSWREFGMTSKFRGKYLQVTPQDFNFIEMGDNNYVWKKVDTCVHNVIVGKLWVDHDGEMIVMNHTTGDKCKLKFTPYSYFSRDTQKKVSGFAMDKDDEPHWFIDGTWDHEMRVSKVIGNSRTKNGSIRIKTEDSKILWQRRYPGPEYEKMYNMTEFAVQLNEYEDRVAPTDSRLRPDQRLMELGKWDESNRVKCLLEEKQRAARRNREIPDKQQTSKNLKNELISVKRNDLISLSKQNSNGSTSLLNLESKEKEDISKDLFKNDRKTVGSSNSPLDGPYWFKKALDPVTKKTVHMYTQEYWQCKEKGDWSRCPDIFVEIDN